MSDWFIGNCIIGNFSTNYQISNAKSYYIEKVEGKLYLCKEDEKIQLIPNDNDSEAKSLVSLFSNESIYQIESSNDTIVVILYVYKDTIKIQGNQSINIHMSNFEELQLLDGSIKNIKKVVNKQEIPSFLRDIFVINDSIFVCPEKNKSDFEIYGDKFQAHVRMERTGVYLLDKLRKISNKPKSELLVQLYGNIKFILWDESTSIQSDYKLELNNVTPSEIFKSWELYEKFLKKQYLDKLKEFGVVKYEESYIDPNKLTVTFLLSEELGNNYNDKNIKFDVLPSDDKTFDYDEIFNQIGSKYLGSFKEYNQESNLLTFSINSELFSFDFKQNGYLFLSNLSTKIEYNRREKVTKQINNKTNSTLNLLMKLSDKEVKNYDFGSDFEPINANVIKNMFNSKDVKINENYREAMYIAINTPDIALIQGPPGSGKTTLIKGIVSRLSLLNKNYHILVSSEQHEALYNVIEKLSQNKNIPPFITSEKKDIFNDENDEESENNMEVRFEKNVLNFQNNLLKVCNEYLEKNRQESNSDKLIDLSFLLQSVKDKNYDKEYIKLTMPKIKQKLIELNILNDFINDVSKIEALVENVSIDSSLLILSKKIDRQILDKDKFISEYGIYEIEGLQNLLKSLNYDDMLMNNEIFEKLHNNIIDNSIFDDYINYINTLKDKINNLTNNSDELIETFENISNGVLAYSSKLPKSIFEIIESLKFRIMDIDSCYEIIKKYTGIIGSTCAQSQKSLEFVNLDSKKYDYVIIDEASHANPLDLMVPIMNGAKVILVGDHKQLPHYIESESLNSFALETKNENKVDTDILKKSLFQILYENLEKAYKEDRIKFRRTIMLEEQHRMHPKIADFISKEFYDSNLKNAFETYENKNDFNICNSKSVAWINVSMFEGGLEQGRYYRESEVKKIIEILSDLVKNNLNRKLDIGIISYYKEQVKCIRNSINVEFPENSFKHSTREMVGTVDSFQGKEFDIVIVSGVRCNNENEGRKRLGFINDEHSRVNVSLTRAKKLLIFVGDEETYGKNELFQDFIKYVKEEGYYE